MPDSLISWVLSRDFNRDGIPDLFVSPTAAPLSSAQLYQGYFENGELKFRVRRMGSPFATDATFPFLYFNIGTQWFSTEVPFTDLPEIIDIDADGDLDMLSFDLVGSFVVYYRNMQVEEGLPQDSIKFVVEDFCFGKFKESGLNGSLILSDDSDECATGFRDDNDSTTRGGGAHAGSTIMGFDNLSLSLIKTIGTAPIRSNTNKSISPS